MRWLMLLVAAVGLNGCILVHHDNDDHHDVEVVPVRGDITFYWNFDGYNCAQTKATWQNDIVVRLDMSGDYGAISLQDNYFSCVSANGQEGITVENFDPGPYTFTLGGYEAGNLTYPIYETTGTVEVNGDVKVYVRLNSLGL